MSHSSASDAGDSGYDPPTEHQFIQLVAQRFDVNSSDVRVQTVLSEAFKECIKQGIGPMHRANLVLAVNSPFYKSAVYYESHKKEIVAVMPKADTPYTFMCAVFGCHDSMRHAPGLSSDDFSLVADPSTLSLKLRQSNAMKANETVRAIKCVQLALDMDHEVTSLPAEEWIKRYAKYFALVREAAAADLGVEVWELDSEAAMAALEITEREIKAVFERAARELFDLVYKYSSSNGKHPSQQAFQHIDEVVEWRRQRGKVSEMQLEMTTCQRQLMIKYIILQYNSSSNQEYRQLLMAQSTYRYVIENEIAEHIDGQLVTKDKKARSAKRKVKGCQQQQQQQQLEEPGYSGGSAFLSPVSRRNVKRTALAADSEDANAIAAAQALCAQSSLAAAATAAGPIYSSRQQVPVELVALPAAVPAAAAVAAAPEKEGCSPCSAGQHMVAATPLTQQQQPQPAQYAKQSASAAAAVPSGVRGETAPCNWLMCWSGCCSDEPLQRTTFHTQLQ